MATFTPAQTAFRFYADDVSESGSTALGVQSDNYFPAVDSNVDLGLRIRIQNNGSGAGATTDDWQLQFSVNGAAFANLTTSSTECLAFASSFLTDAGLTTNRLGAGSGSFVAGEVSETGLVTDRQLTGSNFTEHLFTVRLVAANLAVNDVIAFRVLLNGAILSGGYTVTPEIHVVKNQFGAVLGLFSARGASIADPVVTAGAPVVVAADDLIVAVLSQQTLITLTAVTDDLGNSYTAVSAGVDDVAHTQRIFYSVVTAPGTLNSVSLDTTAGAQDFTAAAVVIRGPFDASPLDAAPAPGTADLTSPFIFPSTGTLAQADEVVLAITTFGNMTFSVILVNSTMPMKHVENVVFSGNVIHTSIGVQIVSATTEVVPEMTNPTNPSNSFIAATLSFKKGGPGEQFGESRLAGAGSFSAAAQQNHSVTPRFNGAGSLSVRASQSHQATATFAGAGSLSAHTIKNLTQMQPGSRLHFISWRDGSRT